MWRAKYEPQCDIADLLADFPVLGQSTYLEDVNLCITSSLKLGGLLRRPKLLIGAGPIVNPPQLLATTTRCTGDATPSPGRCLF